MKTNQLITLSLLGLTSVIINGKSQPIESAFMNSFKIDEYGTITYNDGFSLTSAYSEFAAPNLCGCTGGIDC